MSLRNSLPLSMTPLMPSQQAILFHRRSVEAALGNEVAAALGRKKIETYEIEALEGRAEMGSGVLCIWVVARDASDPSSVKQLKSDVACVSPFCSLHVHDGGHVL